MDATRLDDALRANFEATAAARHVVVRQATDLADSGAPQADRGVALSVSDIVDNLQDAPDGAELVARWNWWLGALEVAYGGYQQFTVQASAADPDLDP